MLDNSLCVITCVICASVHVMYVCVTMCRGMCKVLETMYVFKTIDLYFMFI